MAEGKTETPAAESKPAAPAKKKKGGKLGLIFGMVIALPLMFFTMMPTLILLLAGLLPTLIVLITDSDHQRSTAIAIGSLNCAGVTPFVVDLWTHGQTMPYAFHLLANSTTWLIMLGSAGIGQLIVSALPQVLASFTVAKYETRLKILKTNLESLKSSWGPDVATTKPLDRVGQRE